MADLWHIAFGLYTFCPQKTKANFGYFNISKVCDCLGAESVQLELILNKNTVIKNHLKA